MVETQRPGRKVQGRGGVAHESRSRSKPKGRTKGGRKLSSAERKFDRRSPPHLLFSRGDKRRRQRVKKKRKKKRRRKSLGCGGFSTAA